MEIHINISKKISEEKFIIKKIDNIKFKLPLTKCIKRIHSIHVFQNDS
jgi:hypothetical protein